MPNIAKWQKIPSSRPKAPHWRLTLEWKSRKLMLRCELVPGDPLCLKVRYGFPALIPNLTWQHIDFHNREKIQHFDHERIPERVVHARGSAAHGEFKLHTPLTGITTAKVNQRAKCRMLTDRVFRFWPIPARLSLHMSGSARSLVHEAALTPWEMSVALPLGSIPTKVTGISVSIGISLGWTIMLIHF